MRYMMLIHHDEAAMAAAPQKELWADYAAFNEALARRAAATRAANGCGQPGARAARSRAARPTCSTAPMPTPRSSSRAISSSRPPDLDEAVAWAKRCPSTRVRLDRDPPSSMQGQVEVTDADEAARTAERVARDSYGRLVAFLAARTRDVAGAEDALGEAFAAALACGRRTACPTIPTPGY